MSDTPDVEYLVQLWAQMMYYDKKTERWIVLADNEINDIVVMKRLNSPLYHTVAAANQRLRTCKLTGGKRGINDELWPTVSPPTPAYEYYIQARTITDGKVFFECMIESDLVYVESDPTFYYWDTSNDQRFGIEFQTTEDSMAFAHAVKITIERTTDASRFRCNYNVPSEKDLFQKKLVHLEPIQEELVQLEPIREELVPKESVQEVAAQVEPIQEKLVQIESFQEESTQMVPFQANVIQQEFLQMKTFQEKIVCTLLCIVFLIFVTLCINLSLR